MNYANTLRNYDLKVTPQRVAIVQELYDCGHLNIDQLYNKLLDKFPSISLATIYKNMNAMIEKIFVQWKIGLWINKRESCSFCVWLL